MAAHGKGLLRLVLFGTTTLEMLHHCGVPIWFVPEGASLVARFAQRLQEVAE